MVDRIYYDDDILFHKCVINVDKSGVMKVQLDCKVQVSCLSY